MPIFNTGLAKTSAGFTIPYSLRCSNEDSHNLSRTPTSTGNRKTWTLSTWFKIASTPSGGHGYILSASGDATNSSTYIIKTAELMRIERYNGDGSYAWRCEVGSERSFRDPSAWYHLVVIFNSANSTEGDRIKVYINGELQTNNFISTSSDATAVPLNYETDVNTTNTIRLFGYWSNGSDAWDGYKAETHFIDGTAVDVSTFGETGDYGEWKPIEVSGSNGSLTYSTNGFYLNYADAAALGDDAEGSNDFAENSIYAYDQVLDSPTNNFATWNSLSYNGYQDIKEGNLLGYGSDGTSSCEGGTATIGVDSGKWYWENRITNVGSKCAIGIFPSSQDVESSSDLFDVEPAIWYKNNGQIRVNDVNSTYGDSFTTNDIIGVALDLDNNEVKFYKNDVVQAGGTGLYVLTHDTLVVFWLPAQTGQTNSAVTVNFGQDSSFAGEETAQGKTDGTGVGDFFYTPPFGFRALCTKNLPAVDIKPQEHFNTLLYDLAGAQTRTGVGFKPDFVWFKSRGSNYFEHELVDIVRGVEKSLSSNEGDAEQAESSGLTAFLTDGYTLGAGSTYTDSTGDGMVAWNWKAGGNASLNEEGSTDSQVSANVAAGFSIVAYTGTGVVATIGHGLSMPPQVIMVKSRTTSRHWRVYHSFNKVGSPAEDQYLKLNNAQSANDSSLAWNDTAPGADTFTIGTQQEVNKNNADHIAYCWHAIDGYSCMGTFTGNSILYDGPFVYTGFKPAFVLVKNVESSVNWIILDNKRSLHNPIIHYIKANLDGAEATMTYGLDFVANGFKIQDTHGSLNGTGVYIYIAFAETPFKYANAK